ESGQGSSGGEGFVDLSAARPERFPAKVEPMTAQPGKQAFNDPAWQYELKLDGFRILALVHNGSLKLLSRRGLDVTRQFHALRSLSVLVRARAAVVDGEVAAFGE